MSLQTTSPAAKSLHHDSSSGDPNSRHALPLRLPFDIDQGFYSPGRVLIPPFTEILRNRALRMFVDTYKKGSIKAESSFSHYYTDMVAAHLDARQQDRLDFKYGAENVHQVSFDSFDFIADICEREEWDVLDIRKESRALDFAEKETKDAKKIEKANKNAASPFIKSGTKRQLDDGMPPPPPKRAASTKATSEASSRSSKKIGANRPDNGVIVNSSLPWELIALIELKWVNLGLHFRLGMKWKTREAIYQTIWYLHAAFRLRKVLVGKAQVNECFGRMLVLRNGCVAVEVTRQTFVEGASLGPGDVPIGAGSSLPTHSSTDRQLTLTIEQFDELTTIELPNKLISDHNTWATDEAGLQRFHAFYLSMFWLASQIPETPSGRSSAAIGKVVEAIDGPPQFCAPIPEDFGHSTPITGDDHLSAELTAVNVPGPLYSPPPFIATPSTPHAAATAILLRDHYKKLKKPRAAGSDLADETHPHDDEDGGPDGDGGKGEDFKPDGEGNGTGTAQHGYGAAADQGRAGAAGGSTLVGSSAQKAGGSQMAESQSREDEDTVRDEDEPDASDFIDEDTGEVTWMGYRYALAQQGILLRLMESEKMDQLIAGVCWEYSLPSSSRIPTESAPLADNVMGSSDDSSSEPSSDFSGEFVLPTTPPQLQKWQSTTQATWRTKQEEQVTGHELGEVGVLAELHGGERV